MAFMMNGIAALQSNLVNSGAFGVLFATTVAGSTVGGLTFLLITHALRLPEADAIGTQLRAWLGTARGRLWAPNRTT